MKNYITNYKVKQLTLTLLMTRFNANNTNNTFTNNNSAVTADPFY